MAAFEDFARAKINLTLRVLGRRGDGYHELDSLVAFASTGDRVDFINNPELSLHVMGRFAAACGPAADNLVVKAIRKLSEEIARPLSGHFTLEKRLPVASGIGGGSADAAAALRLAARAFHIAPDDPRLIKAALRTGADVAACLVSRASIMRGFGDVLTPIAMPRLPCVLINPGIAVSTASVFAALAPAMQMGRPPLAQWPSPGAGAAEWLDAISTGVNDLEQPALELAPQISEVLALIRATRKCVVARMSGSGATCFGLYDSPAAARAAARWISELYPSWWVRAAILR